MTKAEAKTAAADLIELGYSVQVEKDLTGIWVIDAVGQEINASAAASFATSHGITAVVNQARFK